MAIANLRLERIEPAFTNLDRCLKDDPARASCLTFRANLLAGTGKCAAAEADARRLMTLEPDGDGVFILTNVLLAQGQQQAARELMRKAQQKIPEAERKAAIASDEAWLATLNGDFQAADARARVLAAASENDGEEYNHAMLARSWATQFEEMGRPVEARRVARNFFERRAAWEPDATRTESAIIADPTGVLLHIERRAGGITQQQYLDQRQARVDWWKQRIGNSWLWYYVWEALYSYGVQTPEEAKEALAARPAFGKKYEPSKLGHEFSALGRVYLLAGRVDEALAELERATNNCMILTSEPFEVVRAWFWLGEARAAKGDRAGACAAYDKLLSHWGKAKPRSLTADKARARRAALGCK